MENSNEFKLYGLTVLTHYKGMLPENVSDAQLAAFFSASVVTSIVLAPGRNPEEAEKYFFSKNPTRKDLDLRIAGASEIKLSGFRIKLEEISA